MDFHPYVYMYDKDIENELRKINPFDAKSMGA